MFSDRILVETGDLTDEEFKLVDRGMKLMKELKHTESFRIQFVFTIIAVCLFIFSAFFIYQGFSDSTTTFFEIFLSSLPFGTVFVIVSFFVYLKRHAQHQQRVEQLVQDLQQLATKSKTCKGMVRQCMAKSQYLRELLNEDEQGARADAERLPYPF